MELLLVSLFFIILVNFGYVYIINLKGYKLKILLLMIWLLHNSWHVWLWKNVTQGHEHHVGIPLIICSIIDKLINISTQRKIIQYCSKFNKFFFLKRNFPSLKLYGQNLWLVLSTKPTLWLSYCSKKVSSSSTTFLHWSFKWPECSKNYNSSFTP